MVALPAGDVPEPIVEVDDIADVAVAALTENGHVGRLYEVTGPRLLTFGEAAEELSRAMRRDVHYQPITLEAFRMSRMFSPRSAEKCSMAATHRWATASSAL